MNNDWTPSRARDWRCSSRFSLRKNEKVNKGPYRREVQRILSLVGLFVYGVEVCYQKIACIDFKWCVLLHRDRLTCRSLAENIARRVSTYNFAAWAARTLETSMI